MPVIEGVGDEVLQFIAFSTLAFLVIAAWNLTKVRQLSNLRTQERRLRRNQEHRLTNVANTRNAATGTLGEPETTSSGNTNDSNISVNPSLQNNTKDQHSSSSLSGCGMRLHIKLKFQNDLMKTVGIDLDEEVGEFRRRNFHSELSQGRIVILIFNGKILENDRLPLRAYGLFHGCVLLCMLRQQPNIQRRPRVAYFLGGRSRELSRPGLRSRGSHQESTARPAPFVPHQRLAFDFNSDYMRRLVRSTMSSTTTRCECIHTQQFSRNSIFPQPHHSFQEVRSRGFIRSSVHILTRVAATARRILQEVNRHSSTAILISFGGFLQIGFWYFRYHHSRLFSLPSTVGLLFMSGMYAVFVVSLFFPEAGGNRVPEE